MGETIRVTLKSSFGREASIRARVLPRPHRFATTERAIMSAARKAGLAKGDYWRHGVSATGAYGTLVSYSVHGRAVGEYQIV